MRFRSPRVVALSFLVGPAVSFAAHPLVTDDTSTQGTGRRQIEINTDRASAQGAWSQSGAVAFSYGVAPNLDLFVNLPASLTPITGIGDTSLGTKWRFLEGKSSSLGLKSELLLPTGSDRDGLGTGRTSAAFTLISSTEAASWAFHANLALAGYRYRLKSIEEANRQYVWRASSAVVYSLRPGWSFVADAGIARNPAAGASQNPAYLLGGAIYSPADNIDLDIGWKAGLNAAEANRQFGVGLTVRF